MMRRTDIPTAVSGERTGVDALDTIGLFKADQAFLDTQAGGATAAASVRAALLAYVEHAATPQEDAQEVFDGLTQMVVSLPADHPDLAGGQVLVRSFDGGDSWEVCTRPDTFSTWSVGVQAVSA